MRTYRIDTGDSATGPCGFVAYIHAKSKRQALRKLREEVSNSEPFKVVRKGTEAGDGEFTVLVYLNPDNVKLSEVSPE